MAVNWNVDKLVESVRENVLAGVTQGAEDVASEAIRNILAGDKTGRVYVRRGVSHTASAPGEAPANDTGRLVNSKRIETDDAALLSSAIFSTAYAAALEYGRLDGSILPRPYARPALATKREQIGKDIEKRVFDAIERDKK